MTKEALEIREIGELKPHPQNPKKHPKEQVKTLAGLIKKFGWTQPIIVQKSTGFILAGHGRRLAALDLKLDRVPVIVKDCSDEEALAILLSDNRAVSNEYDTALLQQQIVSLSDLGMDLTELGFLETELSFLQADLGAFDSSVFVDDISTAVDQQRADNEKTTAAVDESNTGTGEAFGFKKVTFAQARRIKGFIGRLEAETGKLGADALMHFLDEFGVA